MSNDAPLPRSADARARQQRYEAVARSIDALLEGEVDWVSAMATVACELHNAFEYYHWTGFYRVVAPELLAVGPYQGGHGCLSIAFARGVCGAAARTRKTQLVDDVELFEGHIACSSTTRSEVVVPVFDGDGEVIAVFDVDSNDEAAFTLVDQHALEALFAQLGPRFADSARLMMRPR
jgi:L-methionine (R)-S-oxide reductase